MGHPRVWGGYVRITIDNLDGKGAVEYTGAVAATGPITVQRALNAVSRCTAEIVLGVGGLAVPARRGRVVVTNDAGTVLFTGYLATEPVKVWAGESSAGPVYVGRIAAVSDEWLLDNLSSGAGLRDTEMLGLSGSAVVQTLATRAQAAGSAGVVVETSSALAVTGSFAPNAGKAWSENAGVAAGAAYGAYRALNGQVLIAPIGATTHALSDADGTLSVSELTTGNVRELANDVTLTGALEPAAYVTETFEGDGTTTVFTLSGAAYRDAGRTLVRDAFSGTAFDAAQWAVADPGGHLSLTSAGLTLNGGNGLDGQTMLTALDAMEMAGQVVVQLSGVVFGAASEGMLGGMYAGTSVLANCFAGFRVRQSVSSTGGVTVVVPVLQGAEVGTVFTPTMGHTYTLRMRLHCVEMQRVMQRYYCMVDGAVEGFGVASGVSAPMDVVFELVDEGAASNTPATVLYDSAAVTGLGSVQNTPATCAFVAVNAEQMFGSVAGVSVTRPGSVWVVSMLPSGVVQTRLIGAAGQGVDCTVSYGVQATAVSVSAGSAAKVRFLAGRVPVAGERVTVLYRDVQRSVARLASAASVASEAVNGAPGVCRWLGHVSAPVARSSADCESAAAAVLAFATSRDATLAGRYSMVNPTQDVWPGDVLAMTSAGETRSVLVRSVEVIDGHAQPEVVRYKLAFANDWATEWAAGVGLKLSEEVANDAVLPTTAATGPGQWLANLQQLQVTAVSASAVSVSAGVTAPTGGGFEVRLSEWEFGAGVDAADLVLRSPVPNFSIPLAAQVQRFYVRMYDGSTPPVYSRYSSGVFVNAPVS